ncbi:hypothetical protein D3H55_11570 [Bacillus salacetis]|uniref:Uncharacterized protein n=1 Tax=Bacillus salacetis TaxID=2315464 RepID=A0A3A1R3C2_9BACI|nr:hypothetical protein [Bacillus salacetis]RIW33292.1 hypothetical protein D3H55_11570 [Bacillus salacetis]
MKKALIFFVSFLVIFSALQLISGLVLTALYTPDIGAVGEMDMPLSSGTTFGRSFTVPGVILFLAAGCASYFISRTFRTGS